MQFLYNIGIRLLGFSMRLASLFNPKAKKWISGRKNYFQNLPIIKEELYWFHCASLGEFDQALPLMKMIKANEPHVHLMVTFFSPSGMEHYEKRTHHADSVYYLPLDTKANARKFIAHFKPTKTFFIKYEFWANFIFAAKENGSKIYNTSGIFREDHRFFKWYGGYFRKILLQFDWFFVQNKASQNLLASIDILNVSISGDSRYDQVIENKARAKKDPILEHFCGSSTTFIIGSSWPQDEKIILPALEAFQQKFIIAPHNIDEKHIDSICKQLTKTFQRYSKYDSKKETTILILDTIGHLSNAYSYGTLAYVGGGFSGNLHNILEPAVFGLPVMFGPNHIKFPEAQQFIDSGFGFSVETTQELVSAVAQIENSLEEIKAKEIAFVKANSGTSQRIYDKITSNRVTVGFLNFSVDCNSIEFHELFSPCYPTSMIDHWK